MLRHPRPHLGATVTRPPIAALLPHGDAPRSIHSRVCPPILTSSPLKASLVHSNDGRDQAACGIAAGPAHELRGKTGGNRQPGHPSSVHRSCAAGASQPLRKPTMGLMMQTVSRRRSMASPASTHVVARSCTGRPQGLPPVHGADAGPSASCPCESGDAAHRPAEPRRRSWVGGPRRMVRRLDIR